MAAGYEGASPLQSPVKRLGLTARKKKATFSLLFAFLQSLTPFGEILKPSFITSEAHKEGGGQKYHLTPMRIKGLTTKNKNPQTCPFLLFGHSNMLGEHIFGQFTPSPLTL